jgi:hypothetical protein
MNINLQELEEDMNKNFKERMKFVSFWANYVKNHDDKDWSEQQNTLINSQLF